MAAMFGLPSLKPADVPRIANLPREKRSVLKAKFTRSLTEDRVSVIDFKQKEHVLKIFRVYDDDEDENSSTTSAELWKHDCNANVGDTPPKLLEQELKVYDLLASKKCTLAPKLVALVHADDDANQVIGFVCEYIKGEQAQMKDIEKCKEALKELHSYDFVHGDLFNCEGLNLLMTTDGPKFFDFEHAMFKNDSSSRRKMTLAGYENSRRNEMEEFSRYLEIC